MSNGTNIWNIVSLHPQDVKGQDVSSQYVVGGDRQKPDLRAGFKVYNSDRGYDPPPSFLSNIGNLRLPTLHDSVGPQHLSFLLDSDSVNFGNGAVVGLPLMHKIRVQSDGVPVQSMVDDLGTRIVSRRGIVDQWPFFAPSAGGSGMGYSQVAGIEDPMYGQPQPGGAAQVSAQATRGGGQPQPAGGGGQPQPAGAAQALRIEGPDAEEDDEDNNEEQQNYVEDMAGIEEKDIPQNRQPRRQARQERHMADWNRRIAARLDEQRDILEDMRAGMREYANYSLQRNRSKDAYLFETNRQMAEFQNQIVGLVADLREQKTEDQLDAIIGKLDTLVQQSRASPIEEKVGAEEKTVGRVQDNLSPLRTDLAAILQELTAIRQQNNVVGGGGGGGNVNIQPLADRLDALQNRINDVPVVDELNQVQQNLVDAHNGLVQAHNGLQNYLIGAVNGLQAGQQQNAALLQQFLNMIGALAQVGVGGGGNQPQVGGGNQPQAGGDGGNQPPAPRQAQQVGRRGGGRREQLRAERDARRRALDEERARRRAEQKDVEMIDMIDLRPPPAANRPAVRPDQIIDLTGEQARRIIDRIDLTGGGEQKRQELRDPRVQGVIDLVGSEVVTGVARRRRRDAENGVAPTRGRNYLHISEELMNQIQQLEQKVAEDRQFLNANEDIEIEEQALLNRERAEQIYHRSVQRAFSGEGDAIEIEAIGDDVGDVERVPFNLNLRASLRRLARGLLDLTLYSFKESLNSLGDELLEGNQDYDSIRNTLIAWGEHIKGLVSNPDNRFTTKQLLELAFAGEKIADVLLIEMDTIREEQRRPTVANLEQEQLRRRYHPDDLKLQYEILGQMQVNLFQARAAINTRYERHMRGDDGAPPPMEDELRNRVLGVFTHSVSESNPAPLNRVGQENVFEAIQVKLESKDDNGQESKTHTPAIPASFEEMNAVQVIGEERGVPGSATSVLTWEQGLEQLIQEEFKDDQAELRDDLIRRLRAITKNKFPNLTADVLFKNEDESMAYLLAIASLIQANSERGSPLDQYTRAKLPLHLNRYTRVTGAYDEDAQMGDDSNENEEKAVASSTIPVYADDNDVDDDMFQAPAIQPVSFEQSERTPRNRKAAGTKTPNMLSTDKDTQVFNREEVLGRKVKRVLRTGERRRNEAVRSVRNIISNKHGMIPMEENIKRQLRSIQQDIYEGGTDYFSLKERLDNARENFNDLLGRFEDTSTVDWTTLNEMFEGTQTAIGGLRRPRASSMDEEMYERRGRSKSKGRRSGRR